MIDLQVSRKQIDEIDSQIVKLFEERMYLTKNARNRS